MGKGVQFSPKSNRFCNGEPEASLTPPARSTDRLPSAEKRSDAEEEIGTPIESRVSHCRRRNSNAAGRSSPSPDRRLSVQSRVPPIEMFEVTAPAGRFRTGRLRLTWADSPSLRERVQIGRAHV